jgi:transcription elongation factor Elf1
MAYIEKHQKLAQGDLVQKYYEIAKKFRCKDKSQIEIYNFVCPICESYMSYLIMVDPAKQAPHQVECANCNSRSSQRAVDCVDLKLFFFLKHTR